MAGIKGRLYCLYCTNEGHCIVAEMFDQMIELENYLVDERVKETAMDIPNHTRLYKLFLTYTMHTAAIYYVHSL